jgi:hypothetical protein
MSSTPGRLCKAALLSMTMFGASAFAQGGPPLVTDDPDTPGDGHWEINLASTLSRTPAGRAISAPDADINYGWGEHAQLKLDMPWVFASTPAQGARSGLGAADFGVKWRFVDQDDAGYAVSIYPQYTTRLLVSSTVRGVAPAGHEVFLPAELSSRIAGFGIDAEVGRNFVESGPSQWQAGIVGAHACGAAIECVAEIHETASSASRQTLLNVGLRWKLDDSLTILGAGGREFGEKNGAQQQLLLYLGVQFDL